jgi:thioesterase domain-containing protein/acyl carrier protein
MKLENIESVYPLSPMQESMLFYAQSRVTAKQADIKNSELTHDVLFNQTNVDISGNIQLSEFTQAWQQIVNDNSAFRTGFLWEGLKQAQQFVRKQIELPFEFTDLSALEEQEKTQKLDELMLTDQARGFDLNKAPLMRVQLVKLATNNYRLIWSSHHLIVDRWCIPIVFETLTQYYDALIQQQPLPTKNTPPFKRYIAWRLKQSFDKSEQYWQTNLAGFSQSSQLCERMPSAPSIQVEHFIEVELMEQVKQFCRSHKITLASFFQSAWGLTLNQLLGLQDVVYGLVVSGRPARIKDVENIIGSFVNNVPVRFVLNEDVNALQWLKENQSQGFQRIEHEHESIFKLHHLSHLQIDDPLFDHVLVWQNEAQVANSQFLKLSPLPGKLNTAYPLTISIEEKDQGLHLAAMVKAGWQFMHKDTLFSVLESVMRQLSLCSADKKLKDINGFLLSDAFQVKQPFDNFLVHSSNMPSGKLLDKVVTGRTKLTKVIVEEFLIQEWKSILELDDIGLDDDFFALGGTSLNAAQLVVKLEHAEQKHIPIIQLFAGRTIRSMTQVYLHSDWSIKPEWAIPVNTKGKGAPIFYIASPEVNTIGFANLIREVGPELSGYIVQPPPKSEHVRQVRTHEMPALSLEFINKIRQIQAKGPYRIVGMCSGAHISAEIVRQMEKQSLEVSFFGVINTWSLYSISALYHCEKFVDFYRMLRYYTRRLSSIKWSEVKNRFLPALRNKIIPNNPEERTVPATDIEHSAPVRQYDITVSPIKEEKWASERPQNMAKIKHPVTLFRIKSKPYWRIRSYAQGWEHLAEEIKVIPLKEQVHEAILREPHVGHFAKQLRAEILSVETNQLNKSQ